MGTATETYYVTTGDTRRPLGRTLRDGKSGRAVDLTGKTVQFRLVADADDSVIVNWSSASIVGTSTFTADTETEELISAEHTLRVGDEVFLSNSGGALPAGLNASQRYFVRDVKPNRFRLSVTQGGDAVGITGAGTGTHSYQPIGRVQYDFQSADVDTAGEYWAWFRIVQSGEYTTFPPDGRTFQVVISDAG